MPHGSTVRLQQKRQDSQTQPTQDDSIASGENSDSAGALEIARSVKDN